MDVFPHIMINKTYAISGSACALRYWQTLASLNSIAKKRTGAGVVNLCRPRLALAPLLIPIPAKISYRATSATGFTGKDAC